MLEDYQNKVCVVTGAASGIGKALCEKLVALGAHVQIKATRGLGYSVEEKNA